MDSEFHSLYLTNDQGFPCVGEWPRNYSLPKMIRRYILYLFELEHLLNMEGIHPFNSTIRLIPTDHFAF